MITTREVIRKTKVSRSTLFRWAKGGLIPRPTVGIQPKGAGRTSWWTASALTKIRRIAYWTRRGLTHKEAAKKAVPSEN